VVWKILHEAVRPGWKGSLGRKCGHDYAHTTTLLQNGQVPVTVGSNGNVSFAKTPVGHQNLPSTGKGLGLLKTGKFSPWLLT
jgi:hypothetical protein